MGGCEGWRENRELDNVGEDTMEARCEERNSCAYYSSCRSMLEWMDV